jgi:choline dehydrogenase
MTPSSSHTDLDLRPARQFDYIIVGAGSAGCVVARRVLDHSDATVLVLEAGGPSHGAESISDPARWTENLSSQFLWPYTYTPGPHTDNRVIGLPRGKVLGGSGSINAVVWARGHRADYDGWAAAGNNGWDYESILPLFKKSEDWEDGESRFRGSGGPLHIERTRAEDLSLPAAALVEACASFGIPYVDDLNGPTPKGVGLVQGNVRNGIRCDPWNSYLQPVDANHRLTVLTGAHVVRLRLLGSRCTGVDYLIDGKLHSASASNETVLAAGAIDTPRLLLLSGIGPHQDLKGLGIPTNIDLPGVGGNLQDHILLSGMYFEGKQVAGTVAGRRGRTACFWTSRPNLEVPDLMLMATKALPSALSGHQVALPENPIAIVPALMRVASRGRLRMLSAAHNSPLDVQPNFLAERADLDALLRGAELVFELTSQPAFRELIKTGARSIKLRGRAEAEVFLRSSCTSYFHPVGTCTMGSGGEAVVDAKLRVHGVEGLRIADASIMPTIPSANTHAATIMIGEFAARLIEARM